jgi:hypothetical protein
MDYPEEFSKQAKARVTGAIAEAVSALILQKGVKTGFLNPAGPALEYAASVFYAYSCEACDLGCSCVWDVDLVDKKVRDVIHSVVIDARTECRHYGVDLPIFDLFDSRGLSSHFWVHFKAMPAWQHYQVRLREIAKIQSEGIVVPSGSENDSPISAPKVDVKTVGEQLDEIALRADITHDEQAHRIGIGRTAYYEVKNGRGGKKARTKTYNYLKRVASTG